VCTEYRGKISGWVDVCADLSKNLDHCGACNRRCGAINVVATCDAGQCKCSDGMDPCFGTLCPGLNNNKYYCGSCNNVCRDDQACEGGSCKDCGPGEMGCWTVEEGFATCKDVLSNPNHCGGCGLKCPEGRPCVNGVCGCPDGKTWCANANACVDLKRDPRNCGACNSFVRASWGS
jgi:hypothetical protein